MQTNSFLSNLFFIIFSLIVLTFINPIISLVLGIIFASIYKDKSNIISSQISSYPLQIGIVILGMTISLNTLLPIAKDYSLWISFFVIFTFFICYLFCRLLGLENKLALLLSSGTAICGATAMAVVAPLIRAKSNSLLISLAIIYILNTVAIIIFPFFGSYLNMTNYQFGVFGAFAIHDTGSVIGSALQFNDKSVETAVSIKMLRTLWLIPLIILLNLKFNNSNTKNVFPLFIILFLFAVIFSNMADLSYEVTEYLKIISKTFISYGIFVIGLQASGVSLNEIRFKPFIATLGVWIIVIPIAYLVATN